MIVYLHYCIYIIMIYIYIVICRIRLFEFVSINIHMHFCMHPQFSCAIGIYHAQVGRVLFFCLPTPRHGSMARNWWVFKNDPKRLGWNCWIFSWNWAFSPWAVLRLCSSRYVLSCQGMNKERDFCHVNGHFHLKRVKSQQDFTDCGPLRYSL